MNELSATVKSLRKQFNMTQEDLSIKSGVGINCLISSIMRWSHNRNKINSDETGKDIFVILKKQLHNDRQSLNRHQ